jgi:hypothetical protein
LTVAAGGGVFTAVSNVSGWAQRLMARKVSRMMIVVLIDKF